MTQQIVVSTGHVTTLDDDDYVNMREYRWNYNGRYVFRCRLKSDPPGPKMVYLHREICGDGDETDHKDGNELNNCRSNLRPCTHRQNMENKSTYRNNKSGHPGVHRASRGERWEASLRGKYLGVFYTKDEAIKCRQEAELLTHFGDF